MAAQRLRLCISDAQILDSRFQVMDALVQFGYGDEFAGSVGCGHVSGTEDHGFLGDRAEMRGF